MPLTIQKITPCLWFDSRAEEAVKLYTSIFKNSRIVNTTRYGKEGFEIHGKPEGTVLTVEFEIEGQRFTALNGGPQFKFSEAVSFQISCETQDEIDHFWTKLIADGGEESHCGWLKDRFGVSWQVVPSILSKMMTDPDPKKVDRVTHAFLQMTKFDLAKLKQAYDG